MKLFKFKNYISNTIAECIFNNFNIYEENLYSKDSNFSVVSSLNLPYSTQEEKSVYQQNYQKQLTAINSLSKSPEESEVLNTDFCFSIHLDSLSMNTGVSLHSLIKISEKLHTDLVFVNGDGADYQLGDYTGGHDSEVIIHIQFIGDKKKLIHDYKEWYIAREKHLQQKIQKKSNTIRN